MAKYVDDHGYTHDSEDERLNPIREFATENGIAVPDLEVVSKGKWSIIVILEQGKCDYMSTSPENIMCKLLLGSGKQKEAV